MFDTPEQQKFVTENTKAMLQVVLAIHLAPPGTVTGLSEAGLVEVRRIVGEAQAAGIDTIAVSEA